MLNLEKETQLISKRLDVQTIDQINYFDSWKLKRARPLIFDKVNSYLDDDDKDFCFQLDFNWEGSSYTTESDIIFVVK